MKKTALIHLFALLATVVVAGDHLAAQRDEPDRATLRARVDRRFDVIQLRNGLALKGRDSRNGPAVEITDEGIAIDGQPASGAEVRQKLGATDGALVLELSYLSRE